MTYTLYLVRHGIAEESNRRGDAARRLTADGVRKMREVALGLKRLGIEPDTIISSPLQRAQETAAILSAALTPDSAPQIFALLAPGQAAEDVLAGLHEHRGTRTLMLVGHQPGLGQLASCLLTHSPHVMELPFRKGGVAAISTGSLPPRAPGTLEWFVTAQQLRLMGKRA